MRKQYQNAMCAAVLTAGLLMAGRTRAGDMDPTNAPGPTMHTLKEVYQKVQHLAPQTLQTLTDATTVVQAGYYAATNLTQVDTNLAAANIKTNVTIFGIAGTLSMNAGGSAYSAAVPKTGQTTSYRAGDDGDLEKGVAWPNPRFTVQADTNVVLDNLTGLMWARNANLPGGARNWNDAVDYCMNLTYGGYDDWRLPSTYELLSLIDDSQFDPNPMLPSGHPFADVQSGDYFIRYWSGSMRADNTDYAWYVNLTDSWVNYDYKAGTCFVWPVRGGQ